MGINFVLKKLTDREIRIEIQDKDKHSLPNLIAKLAIKKPGVTFAGYIIEHPMVSYPVLVIMTNGSRNPLDVLKEVIEEAKIIAQEFLESFNKALTNEYKERS
ncbi:MAG: DNA-directed RNA polymerase subunit L [Desulfurococcaceae archaeon]|jgi:DNA-directed RNA polymerase subunit L|nr:DNA-directed RNA polymerase subunit L [Desulfurococcaceae archaeon]